MHLEIDLEKCIDCKNCMLMCSFVNEKVFNPKLSRIKVSREDYTKLSWNVCQQHEVSLCKENSCIRACPRGAISKKGGRIVIDYELCNGCGKCVEVCPFNAIKLHPITKKPIVCVLCLNCVLTCKRGAIRIVDERGRDITEKVLKERGLK
ncbi:MAG TPA: 4Fe-4S dicluster domain-containing protein [Candidatus Aenigmarchaeota archaeon]|nr:4Fe-4S dicluster domain-containing protein [Candidatus Aenigmarchaeota archaeon]